MLNPKLLIQERVLLVDKIGISGKCISSLRIARPINIDLLISASKQVQKLHYWKKKRIHLVAVAQSGIPFATILAAMLHEMGKDVYLSIVDPRRPKSFASGNVPVSLRSIVLVDNSVHSGATIKKAIILLKHHNMKCLGIVAIIASRIATSNMLPKMPPVFSVYYTPEDFN